jgi:hypothetical protein
MLINKWSYISVSEKGSRKGRTAVNRGNTRTVMSGDVYEIRQKTSETCRGCIQHSRLGFFHAESSESAVQ